MKCWRWKTRKWASYTHKHTQSYSEEEERKLTCFPLSIRCMKKYTLLHTSDLIKLPWRNKVGDTHTPLYLSNWFWMQFRETMGLQLGQSASTMKAANIQRVFARYCDLFWFCSRKTKQERCDARLQGEPMQMKMSNIILYILALCKVNCNLAIFVWFFVSESVPMMVIYLKPNITPKIHDEVAVY